jgi:hypothetical protein
LEVLIAFALVVFCALPLLAPHFWMIEKEKGALKQIEADRLSNLVIVYLTENLHHNDYSWETITSGIMNELQVPDNHWLAPDLKNIPFRILYAFNELKSKAGTGEGHTFNLIGITLQFEPLSGTQKPLVFNHQLFVERNIKLGTENKNEKPNEK